MYIVAIAGGSGSGKTTFAEKLLDKVEGEVSVLHMDSYYLPFKDQPKEHFTPLERPNFDHPKAFAWELLRAHILQLKSGKSIEAPIYDFNISERTKETQHVAATKVLIFEGIFTLFDKEIRNIVDIMAFLQVEADVRFIRRLNRDVKERDRSLNSVIDQYYETVRPMYQKFLDPQRQFADFIIGEENDIAASILAAKINDLINNPEIDRSLIRKKSNKLTNGAHLTLG